MRLYCKLFQSFKFIYYFCACLVFIFFNFPHIFLFSSIFVWISFTTAANVMNWNGNTTTNDRFSIFRLILPLCFPYFLYKCSFTMLLFYRAFIVLPGQFIKKILSIIIFVIKPINEYFSSGRINIMLLNENR